MFTPRQTLAIALLAAVAVVTQAGEDAKKEPKTGKNCVTFMSTELTPTGLTKMNFRNICASQFQIQVQAGDKVREGGIEAGTPEKPAKGFVTCKADERCEVAKWQY